MSMNYRDLQDEVKRRSIRNQSGTQYDTATKNVINTSLFRVGREALWRVIRRNTTFPTVTSYTTGTGAVTVTSGSKNFSVTGATFLTDQIQIGRKIKFGGSIRYFTIKTITSETAGTVDINYDGTTSTTEGYEIFPQEEYVLPAQVGHRMFLWHREWGYPSRIDYITDQEFRLLEVDDTVKDIPTNYRMWGEDMAIRQLNAPSLIGVSSSSASDVGIEITVFGNVGGYPDSESINTNGTNGQTVNNGNKVFDYVERVVKATSTVGRITATGNSANVTVAVIPAGDITSGISYKKVQLYPLPTTVFPVNVQYYKDVYSLVNDNDMHELGQEFDEAIILLSVAKIAYENSKKEGDHFFALYKDEINSLRKNNSDKIDWLPGLKRPRDDARHKGQFHRRVTYQQAGPYFGPMVR
jgi:hypothetical protein